MDEEEKRKEGAMCQVDTKEGTEREGGRCGGRNGLEGHREREIKIERGG